MPTSICDLLSDGQSCLCENWGWSKYCCGPSCRRDRKTAQSGDATIGEAQAALLASQIVSSLGIYSLILEGILEGDAINNVHAIQHLDLFKDENFASIISSINVNLLFCIAGRLANSLEVQIVMYTI